MKGFLAKATGLSRAQLTRLVRQFPTTGRIADRRVGAPRRPFERRYTAADIRLLAEADAWPLLTAAPLRNSGPSHR